MHGSMHGENGQSRLCVYPVPKTLICDLTFNSEKKPAEKSASNWIMSPKFAEHIQECTHHVVDIQPLIRSCDLLLGEDIPGKSWGPLGCFQK